MKQGLEAQVFEPVQGWGLRLNSRGPGVAAQARTAGEFVGLPTAPQPCRLRLQPPDQPGDRGYESEHEQHRKPDQRGPDQGQQQDAAA
jgi:hypothetical protein